LNPADYLSLATVHSLRGILDRLLVVVQASARKLVSAFGADVVLRKGYRSALVESAIITNAAWSAYEIQQAFAGDEESRIHVAYGVYLLASRDVWTPDLDRPSGSRLASAPKDAAGFGQLGDAVVRSARITGLLTA